MAIRTSTVRRLAAGALIAGVGVSVPVIAAGAASASTGSVNWNAIAQCESGNNWSIDTGNGFYGGLQFTESTWLAYGGGQYAQYANQASEADQIAVAQNVLAGQGIGAWPVCGANAGSGSSYSATNTSGSSGNSGSTSSTSSTSSAYSAPSTTTTSTSSDNDASADSSATAPAAPATTTSTSTTTAAGSTTGSQYTVVSGDTLSGIAAKLGVSSWQTLYNENSSVVGSNPNLIYPGQTLTY